MGCPRGGQLLAARVHVEQIEGPELVEVGVRSAGVRRDADERGHEEVLALPTNFPDIAVPKCNKSRLRHKRRQGQEINQDRAQGRKGSDSKDVEGLTVGILRLL